MDIQKSLPYPMAVVVQTMGVSSLNAIAYNLVSAIRAGAPDGTLRTARLKQLRYQLFHVAARSARDRRKISVRFAATAEWIRHLISLFQVFPLRTISTG